jgi:glycosyltransferase involved in cell wall biosynthesis
VKTAVVALARQGEGPSGFALALARSFSGSGDSCTLVWAFPDGALDSAQMPVTGVEVLYVNRLDSTVPRLPNFHKLHLSVQLASALRRFDIVYAMLYGHPAMHAARERRFSRSQAPFLVTVVDELPQRLLNVQSDFFLADVNRPFGERYQLQHSDYVICRAPVHAQRLAAEGWALPSPERLRQVAADPRKWSELRQQIEAAASIAAAEPRAIRPARTNPVATVCVPHFNQGDYLSAALESLARQTSRDFTVIAVDDGSTSLESRQTFDRMEERYRPLGWRFLRQQNQGPGAARNLASRHAESEYLLFLDADDVAAPQFVARLVEAARLSGDDVLALWSHRFPVGETPYDYVNGQVAFPPDLIYTPPGHDLTGSLLQDFCGGSTCLVRRDAFDAVGGFPEGLLGAFEGYALQVRMALGGYAADVVPEVLCYYRDTPGSVAKSSHDFWSHDTVRRAFDEKLNSLHLPSFALAFRAIEEIRWQAEQRLASLAEAVAQRHPRTKPQTRLRLLMLVSACPYPPLTGCLRRWWEMIRYFGTRHDLTLVTFMLPDEEKHKRHLLRYCNSVYAASYGGPRPLATEPLPYLVRVRQSNKMREAILSCPTHAYDAALIEQVFLAPYREMIRAPTILGEHNIESSLLACAAQDRLDGELTSGFANARAEAELLRDYEDRVWPDFPLRTAVSEAECDEIQRRAKLGRTIHVDNGTDPDLWLERADPNTGNVLFVGMLGYYPNVDAALYFWREIWPHLATLDSSLQLIIAGSSPTPEVRALRCQPNVTLIEDFADMRLVAARASVSVVPMRLGSGTRIKILDSMALGLPVVSTSLGAKGLAVEDGEHLLIRDEPRAFAAAVHQVQNDRSLWTKLRRNGRRLIEERYRWDRVFDPLDKALWELASQ